MYVLLQCIKYIQKSFMFGAILSAFIQQVFTEVLLDISPLISSFSQEIPNIWSEDRGDRNNNMGQDS